MSYLKWGARAVVLAAVAAYLHYVLPSHDVVRIVGTEVRLLDEVGKDAAGNRVVVKDDVYFIKAVEPDGDPRVYRNEDNLWYLKFDSSDLDAEASNLVSTEAAPRWVLVTHYGWRIPYLTMYPNAVALGLADGPRDIPFPWFNVVFLSVLAIALLALRRYVIILRQRHVDPVVDAIDDEIDETVGWWRRQWRRLSGRRPRS